MLEMIIYERNLCISLISEFHSLYFINYERRKIVQNHVIDVDYRKGRKRMKIEFFENMETADN